MISLPDFLPAIKPGLHIVATPIGNLGDMTLRALSILSQVDQILCEDTRVSSKLLQAYGLQGALNPYHEHNAEQIRPKILEKLKAGAKIALISDAGTPLISDPGYKLVRSCYEEHIPVTIAPGPSAVIAGLVLSGLPTDQFFFAGFAQSKKFQDLRSIPATLIFYEAPQRLIETLKEMQAVFSNRDVVVVREITKIFEEVVRGDFSTVMAAFEGQERCRGEMVILLSPPRLEKVPEQDIEELLRQTLKEHSLKDAVTLVAGILGIPKKKVYQHALNLKQEKEELS